MSPALAGLFFTTNAIWEVTEHFKFLKMLSYCLTYDAVTILIFTILVSVQSQSHVLLFVTPWTAACQASLSITNTQTLLKLMSIELVMSSKHLILCCLLLLLPSVFPSIRVFSNVSSSHQVTKVLEFQLRHQSFQ